MKYSIRKATMKSDKYADKIRNFKTKGLYALWLRAIEGTLDDFWKDGKALEYIVLKAFELEGCYVHWPYNVKENDVIVEQIDGFIQFDSFFILSECKDYKAKINVEPIAKMRNQLLKRPAGTVGCLFTTSGYTQPTLIQTRHIAPQTIILWERNEIDYCIKHRCFKKAFIYKYRKAVMEYEFHYDAELALDLNAL